MKNRFELLLIFSLFTLGQCTLDNTFKEKPKAVNGVLDLSSYNLMDTRPVALDGQWSFYWKTFHDFNQEAYIEVPSIWQDNKLNKKVLPGHGFATYRLRIKLQKKDTMVAFDLPTIGSAFEVHVNNEKLVSVGKVGKSPKEMVAMYRPQVVNYFSKEKEIDVLVKVSNFNQIWGGIWYSIHFGSTQAIQDRREKEIRLEFFMIGIFVIMFLYHLGLLVLRRQEKLPLFFGIYCITLALRVLFKGQISILDIFPNLSFEYLLRFDYFTYFAAVPILTIFFRLSFKNEFSKIIYLVILFVGVSSAVALWFITTNFLTSLLLPYQVFTLISIVYGSFVIILAVVRKREGAVAMLIGGSALFLAAINDVLFAAMVINTGFYLQYGLVCLILSQAFLLSQKSAKSFEDIATLSRELTISNAQLKKTNIAYSRFVPEEFLRFLNKDSIIDINLGDQVRENLTILFLDIRSFTTISESLSAKDNFNFLNSLLGRFAPIIRENGGFIDKYIGDAIMALFSNRAETAIKSAILIKRSLEDFNQTKAHSGLLPEPIDIGIGIHSGELMMGMIGEEKRLEGTVISDAVNLTSRIEGLTKSFGTNILISDLAFKETQKKEGFDYRYIGRVLVKGKSTDIGLIEILDCEISETNKLKVETRDDFEKAIEHFNNGKMKLALNIFEKIVRKNTHDLVAKTYIQSITKHQHSGNQETLQSSPIAFSALHKHQS